MRKTESLSWLVLLIMWFWCSEPSESPAAVVQAGLVLEILPYPFPKSWHHRVMSSCLVSWTSLATFLKYPSFFTSTQFSCKYIFSHLHCCNTFLSTILVSLYLDSFLLWGRMLGNFPWLSLARDPSLIHGKEEAAHSFYPRLRQSFPCSFARFQPVSFNSSLCILFLEFSGMS